MNNTLGKSGSTEMTMSLMALAQASLSYCRLSPMNAFCGAQQKGFRSCLLRHLLEAIDVSVVAKALAALDGSFFCFLSRVFLMSCWICCVSWCECVCVGGFLPLCFFFFLNEMMRSSPACSRNKNIPTRYLHDRC